MHYLIIRVIEKAINMEKHHRYLVLIEQDEDGIFVASVPAIKGCHTQAKSLENVWSRVREAIELCLEVETQDEPPMRFVGVQHIELPV
jgi:predicted RNase H-like HicB family nuclease